LELLLDPQLTQLKLSFFVLLPSLHFPAPPSQL
jgi:hypothetical protein